MQAVPDRRVQGTRVPQAPPGPRTRHGDLTTPADLPRQGGESDLGRLPSGPPHGGQVPVDILRRVLEALRRLDVEAPRPDSVQAARDVPAFAYVCAPPGPSTDAVILALCRWAGARGLVVTRAYHDDAADGPHEGKRALFDALRTQRPPALVVRDLAHLARPGYDDGLAVAWALRTAIGVRVHVMPPRR